LLRSARRASRTGERGRPPVSGAPVRRRGGFAVAVVFLAGLGIWGVVILGSVRQTPGWEGWLTGVFAGGFVALLSILGGLLLVLKVLQPRDRSAEREAAHVPVEGELGRILAEVEA